MWVSGQFREKQALIANLKGASHRVREISAKERSILSLCLTILLGSLHLSGLAVDIDILSTQAYGYGMEIP
jgi:hypothetical protein